MVRKKIDILHIASGDMWAGAESQIFYTLSYILEQKQVTFGVILFNAGILEKKLKENGINVKVVDEREKSAINIVNQVRKKIKNEDPNIIHVHGFKEHILGEIANYLSGNKARIVRTLHGMSLVPSNVSIKKWLKTTVVLSIEKLLLKNRRLTIIAVSQDLYHFIKRKYPKANSVQIYNGIEVSIVTEKAIKEIRKSYSVDDSILWIGTAARLVPIKNIDMLLRVGERLTRLGINYKISIFGEGYQEQTIRTKIKLMKLDNNIYLEGFSSEMIKILAALDVFVLTSHHEGLPMSLLEAMSQGTPVVCTAVGGVKEAIEDGVTGMLVDSDNDEEMTRVILNLQNATDTRHMLIRNEKKVVAEKYSVNATASKLLNLYKDIVTDSVN